MSTHDTRYGNHPPYCGCDTCQQMRSYSTTGIGIIGVMNDHARTCADKDCPVCEANKPRKDMEKARAAIAATPTRDPYGGWQCPVCSTVWAPFVRKCEGCK